MKKIIAVSQGFRIPHSHTLEILESHWTQISDRGVTLTTSPAPLFLFWHTHEVVITKSQLEKIARKEAVVLVDDSGIHRFEIKLN